MLLDILIKAMKKNGFTLIEFIIYITIVALVLILVTGFLWNVILGIIKEVSYQEIQQNARFALTKIAQEIRRADGVNTPSPGQSTSLLSLSMKNSDLNPTIFDLSDGKLRITQGKADPKFLTSDQVRVTKLLFTNLSYSDTPGTIRIEMTIEYFNPSNLSQYQASINLKSTISLLPGGASL